MNKHASSFNKVTILGFGLIGSSLARAIRRNNLAESIACGDMSAAVCGKVLELKLADTADTDLAKAVKDADLVILCVPVGAVGAVAKTIAPALKNGAIVTDVGSVKQAVIDAVTPHIPPHAAFVPGHPIAGAEHSGPEAGTADLFVGHWCILTPTAATSKTAADKVAALWTACGSNVEIMEPKRHDLVLAITSHLPHLIAYSIVDTASTLEDHTRADVMKYSAGGFRSVTRTAASDPVMWRDIFLNNREAVLEILQRFNEDITALQKAIRVGDGAQLEDVFTRTRAIRRGVIEAKK
jgi:cyclohexadieny/prephenate dehydrogenase